MDDAADPGGVPAPVLAVPLAFAHHDVDLLGRVPVVDVANARRDEARADQHVASPLESGGPDEDGVGVAVVKRPAVRFRARPPAPMERRLQSGERPREGGRILCRARPFERGGKVTVRRRGSRLAGHHVAGRARERFEDVRRRVAGRGPRLDPVRQEVAGRAENPFERFGASHPASACVRRFVPGSGALNLRGRPGY